MYRQSHRLTIGWYDYGAYRPTLVSRHQFVCSDPVVFLCVQWSTSGRCLRSLRSPLWARICLGMGISVPKPQQQRRVAQEQRKRDRKVIPLKMSFITRNLTMPDLEKQVRVLPEAVFATKVDWVFLLWRQQQHLDLNLIKNMSKSPKSTLSVNY